MKRAALGALLTVIVAVAGPGSALGAEVHVCWTRWVADLDSATPRQIVLCRIGGEIVVYERVGDVPVVLHPAVGSDDAGECWYWRSVFTGWVLARVDGDRALMRFDPDGPGPGPALADGWVPRCDGEPDTGSAIDAVWEVIRRYEFPTPDVELDPAIGLTGLDSFVEVVPPPPVIESIASPVSGTRIFVEFTIGQVEVDWGDGSVTTAPPLLYEHLGGAPGGVLRHAYGQAGRHRIVVSYDWVARWRIDAGPFLPLVLDPTETIIDHRVDELVGRRMSS